MLRGLEVDERVQRELELDAVHGAAPVAGLEVPTDAAIENDGEAAGDGCPIGVDREHDDHAQGEAEACDAQIHQAPTLPMNPLRAPCWGLQHRQREAREVHKGVGDKETHGQQRRHYVQGADQNEASSNCVGEQQRPRRLAMLRKRREGPQDAEDVVLGDLLEEARGHDEALQRLAQRRDDDANEGGLWEGVPDDVMHDGPPNVEALEMRVGLAGLNVALQVAVVRDGAPE
mmetsp:Transcript_85555/g.246952  ORF Transcript_85555/g.246952 Transcript_85555/m.246952 type:complete len:231 (-) Transcript_85555:1068-1760(-)